MKQNSKASFMSKQVWKNAGKIFAKSLLLFVFVFFYLISVFFVFSPKIDSKIFSLIGFKRAEEACYVRIYDKSNDLADLYNLIVFESEVENYEKELYYINLMMADDRYNDFCKMLDESSANHITNKAIVAYSCNVNSYFVNQKVICMYNLGFDSNKLASTVKTFVKNQLSKGDIYNTAISTYVDLVYNDESLKESEKVEHINILCSAMTLELNKRIEDIDNVAANGLVEQIICQNTKVAYRRALYLIDEITDSPTASLTKQAYQNELKTYNELIKI